MDPLLEILILSHGHLDDSLEFVFLLCILALKLCDHLLKLCLQFLNVVTVLLDLGLLDLGLLSFRGGLRLHWFYGRRCSLFLLLSLRLLPKFLYLTSEFCIDHTESLEFT